MTSQFWEEREQVERFAAREPDKRLVDLLADYAEPATIRVLDIGCAGGRNTELLAVRGFDVHAVDASQAMVSHTRERLAPVLGREAAASRVSTARMDDLSRFTTADFDLVVALGVYHSAESVAEWEAALAETARVMKPDGKLLVAVFEPRCDMTGDGLQPVAGEPNVFAGLPSGRHYLVDAAGLDVAMARHGFTPIVTTDTVYVPLERGQRVTVNALYCHTGGRA